MKKNDFILMQETKEVICCSCKKRVTVTLIAFGCGRIAICPLCSRVAYNGS